MNAGDLPTSSKFLNVNTAAAGATWAAFAAENCLWCKVHNPNSVDVDVSVGGAGAVITVPAKGAKPFFGVRDTSTLQVRRTDQSNAQVQMQAEAFHA